MRWYIVALIGFVITALAFIPVETIYDDGLPEVSVTVRVAGRPIKGISAEAFVTLEAAQQMLISLPPLAYTRAENSMCSAVQEPKRPEPLRVKVWTSDTRRRALLWTYGQRRQYRGLLVVVEYENGQLEGTAVEIPEMRQDRHIIVDVP